MSTIELKVPDIGDFDQVEVIEVLVAEGDKIEAEQSLITVESDKASMEIPAPQAGVVRKLAIKVGDKIAEGGVILELEPAGEAEPQAEAAEPAKPTEVAAGNESKPATGDDSKSAPASAPAAAKFEGKADLECDVLVLGAGPGG